MKAYGEYTVKGDELFIHRLIVLGRKKDERDAYTICGGVFLFVFLSLSFCLFLSLILSLVLSLFSLCTCWTKIVRCGRQSGRLHAWVSERVSEKEKRRDIEDRESERARETQRLSLCCR
jgi:hypothetical protein